MKKKKRRVGKTHNLSRKKVSKRKKEKKEEREEKKAGQRKEEKEERKGLRETIGRVNASLRYAFTNI